MSPRPAVPTPRSPVRRTTARLLGLLLVAVAAGAPSLLTGTASAAGAWADAPSPASAGWPLSPRPEVVSRFDPPSSAWAAGHRGVDLLGIPGQPVRAAAGGTVAYAGLLAGKGVVVVRHGASRTTYEPVDAVVDVGAAVAPGDVLGHLHPGGSHCLPRTCLHWGLIEDTADGDAYRDPLTLVGGGPVRLLPWAGLAARAGLGLGAPGLVTPPLVPRSGSSTSDAPSNAGAAGGQARGWAWR